MPQRLRGTKLDAALDTLLRRWEHEPPETMPLTVKAVAARLPASRTSLYREATDPHAYPVHLRSRAARIAAAARRQAENAQFSPQATVTRLWQDRLRQAQDERDEWKAKCAALQLRIAGMEYQAHLQGWDAAVLWQPLPPSDRATRGPGGGTTRWPRGRPR